MYLKAVPGIMIEGKFYANAQPAILLENKKAVKVVKYGQQYPIIESNQQKLSQEDLLQGNPINKIIQQSDSYKQKVTKLTKKSPQEIFLPYRKETKQLIKQKEEKEKEQRKQQQISQKQQLKSKKTEQIKNKSNTNSPDIRQNLQERDSQSPEVDISPAINTPIQNKVKQQLKEQLVRDACQRQVEQQVEQEMYNYSNQQQNNYNYCPQVAQPTIQLGGQFVYQPPTQEKEVQLDISALDIKLIDREEQQLELLKKQQNIEWQKQKLAAKKLVVTHLIDQQTQIRLQMVNAYQQDQLNQLRSQLVQNQNMLNSINSDIAASVNNISFQQNIQSSQQNNQQQSQNSSPKCDFEQIDEMIQQKQRGVSPKQARELLRSDFEPDEISDPPKWVGDDSTPSPRLDVSPQPLLSQSTDLRSNICIFQNCAKRYAMSRNHVGIVAPQQFSNILLSYKIDVFQPQLIYNNLTIKLDKLNFLKSIFTQLESQFLCNIFWSALTYILSYPNDFISVNRILHDKLFKLSYQIPCEPAKKPRFCLLRIYSMSNFYNAGVVGIPFLNESPVLLKLNKIVKTETDFECEFKSEKLIQFLKQTVEKIVKEF
ncbi:Hypothetical_protein [Hexamita inflata]|uniref:Hypothetical_protein n=1 Tax=Hexamita inflata TaxID=28002 RepID=A0ABP1HM40_9EUKA